MSDLESILGALRFAAAKHRDQRRKDHKASPYINHPIDVAELLLRAGKVVDVELLQAAILHDTIEDTETTPEELEDVFGVAVRTLVEEVTDDKTLPKADRKRLQIEHTPKVSAGAKQIKLADKTSNVRDMAHAPPRDWPLERRIEYLEWSREVVAGCRGVNASLEEEFDRVAAEVEALLIAE